MAPLSPPSGAMEQQLRNQHAAPSSGYLGSASPGQFWPSNQSIYLNGSQVQQQQPPPLFPSSEMASSIRFRSSLSSPSYHARGVPLQPHPSPSGFQDAHHAQVFCPSGPQVMSRGYLCDRGALDMFSGRQGTFPGQFSHPSYGGDPGLLPSSPNSGCAGFSAGGTGHEAHTLPSSNPLHGEVGGGGYVCEGEESWKLRGNQHSVGTSSQASSMGDRLARGWDGPFGCLRYGGCGKTYWMEREQEILEDKVLE